MNARIVSLALAMCCLLLCLLGTAPAKSQVRSLGFIFITPDGSVEPSSAPIQRAGDVFTFTGNIYDPVIIERDNVVLDGAGHYLHGNGTGTPPTWVSSGTGPTGYYVGRDNGVGINVTCRNITIMNIHISSWITGILGAYNDNTISGNFITDCGDAGIKIYGNNYTVNGNYIANNNEGIRLSASHTVISRNNLTDNRVGITVFQYGHLIVENNLSNVAYDIRGEWGGAVAIYRNNFFKTDWGSYVSATDSEAVWNNGKAGNFWSAYNGNDTNHDGIGDEPYVIKSVYNPPNIPNMPITSIYGQDTRPLMKPVTIQESLQPSPSPDPSPTPTAPQHTFGTPARPRNSVPTTPNPSPTTTVSPSPQQTAAAPEQTQSPAQPQELIISAAIVVIITSLAVTSVVAKSRKRAEGAANPRWQFFPFCRSFLLCLRRVWNFTNLRLLRTYAPSMYVVKHSILRTY